MITISKLYELFKDSSGVSTDSRKIEVGNIFFALKGENFDGNKFAKKTIEMGAIYAVVDDPNLREENNCLYVENALVALQELATFYRRKFRIPVIGITGSNGKTTTKELLASILSTHYKTHSTKGNFNNHIGVPLTLLAMPKETEVAIVEMGANRIGDIAELCEIAEPSHGMITNIGKAHLEGFGGLEGVKKGKSELYKFLNKNTGVVFVNTDEPFLRELSADLKRKIYYQQSLQPSLEVSYLETKLVSTHPTVEVAFFSDDRSHLIDVKSNLFGQYNFSNILSAISIGRYFKVPAEKIKSAVENYVPTNNRSQVLKQDNITFILDAYNANPTSMKIALNNLDKLEAEKKVVILGDMLEMGEYSKEEHASIFELAKGKDFHQLIFVGKEFNHVVESAENIHHFETVDDAKEWFDEKGFDDVLVLLKGSRGIQLEKILTPAN